MNTWVVAKGRKGRERERERERESLEGYLRL